MEEKNELHWHESNLPQQAEARRDSRPAVVEEREGEEKGGRRLEGEKMKRIYDIASAAQRQHDRNKNGGNESRQDPAQAGSKAANQPVQSRGLVFSRVFIIRGRREYTRLYVPAQRCWRFALPAGT